MRSEREIFLSFLLRHPVRLAAFLSRFNLFVLEYAALHARKKLFAGIWRMRLFFKGCVNTRKVSLNLEKIPGISLKRCQDDLPEAFEVKLAARTLKITDKIDWGELYDDKEDCFALNRFGWLLSLLLRYPSERTADFSVRAIVSWIKNNPANAGGQAWESYSIAERLSNWPLILKIVSILGPSQPVDMELAARSMDEQIQYLLAHLELNGRFTNNHILNNARGLYLGGLALGNDRAMEKGRSLFYHWTEKIFYPDGMSREASSHYQLLMAQRYEQVWCFAKQAGDMEFSSFIGKWSVLIKEAGEFFSVYGSSGFWNMPLIGDISPDFTPEWLAPGYEYGWSRLKSWLGWKEPGPARPASGNGIELKGDFAKYNDHGITVFWHAASGSRSCLTHGHYDLGSFVLFSGAAQIIADPGLNSYGNGSALLRSASVHNTLLIDSHGPECEDHKLNSIGGYGERGLKIEVNASPDGAQVLEMDSYGFQRLNSDLSWKRRFIISPGKMRIEDVLQNPATCSAEARFHIPPGCNVSLAGNKASVYEKERLAAEISCVDGQPCEMTVKGGATGPGPVFSSEYGKSLPGFSICLKREFRGRQVYVYEVRWPNAG